MPQRSPSLAAMPAPHDTGLEVLVTQVAAEVRMDRELVRAALLDDPQFNLLQQSERELHTCSDRPRGPGLLRIALLMAEAADRVAQKLRSAR